LSSPKLELYYYDGCPFCAMVLDAINQLKVKVDYKHIHKDPNNYEKLVKDTGRATTPCLYIDDKPMHESADIISWLNSNIGKLEKEENS
jgi:glutaredoxin 3